MIRRMKWGDPDEFAHRWLCCASDDDGDDGGGGGGDDGGGGGGDDGDDGGNANDASSKDDGSTDKGDGGGGGGGGGDAGGGGGGDAGGGGSGGGGDAGGGSGGAGPDGGGTPDGGPGGPPDDGPPDGATSSPDTAPSADTTPGGAPGAVAAGQAAGAGVGGEQDPSSELAGVSTPVAAALDQAGPSFDSLLGNTPDMFDTQPGDPTNTTTPGAFNTLDSSNVGQTPAPGERTFNDEAQTLEPSGTLNLNTEGARDLDPFSGPTPGMPGTYQQGPGSSPVDQGLPGNVGSAPSSFDFGSLLGISPAEAANVPTTSFVEGTPMSSLEKLLAEAGQPTIDPAQFGFNPGVGAPPSPEAQQANQQIALGLGVGQTPAGQAPAASVPADLVGGLQFSSIPGTPVPANVVGPQQSLAGPQLADAPSPAPVPVGLPAPGGLQGGNPQAVLDVPGAGFPTVQTTQVAGPAPTTTPGIGGPPSAPAPGPQVAGPGPSIAPAPDIVTNPPTAPGDFTPLTPVDPGPPQSDGADTVFGGGGGGDGGSSLSAASLTAPITGPPPDGSPPTPPDGAPPFNPLNPVVVPLPGTPGDPGMWQLPSPAGGQLFPGVPALQPNDITQPGPPALPDRAIPLPIGTPLPGVDGTPVTDGVSAALNNAVDTGPLA